jgi:hypothetical protein
MILNAKTVVEVGYLLVDVLRFWHSTIDCASFGLLSEVSLVVSMLTPFWLLVSLLPTYSGIYGEWYEAVCITCFGWLCWAAASAISFCF